MRGLATITSKRQLTIPAAIFAESGLKEGQKVIVSLNRGKLSLRPATDLVKELAGSVEVPNRFKGLAPDMIISKAKQEYFKKR